MSLSRSVVGLLVGVVILMGVLLFCSLLRQYRFEGMLIGVLTAVAGGYAAARVAGRRQSRDLA